MVCIWKRPGQCEYCVALAIVISSWLSIWSKLGQSEPALGLGGTTGNKLLSYNWDQQAWSCWGASTWRLKYTEQNRVKKGSESWGRSLSLQGSHSQAENTSALFQLCEPINSIFWNVSFNWAFCYLLLMISCYVHELCLFLSLWEIQKGSVPRLGVQCIVGELLQTEASGCSSDRKGGGQQQSEAWSLSKAASLYFAREEQVVLAGERRVNKSPKFPQGVSNWRQVWNPQKL